ncbi:MAG: DUF5939 domain-containing protein [Leptospira sp.]|nr:DUF5939 domain-containing protein [Leptospira sp.]
MIDLDTVLSKYPWDKSVVGKALDFFWEHDLSVTREEIWPYLIDTSSFNKRLGLPRLNYEEKNGRLYGKTKQGGILLEWEEEPWEWEYLKEMANGRIYSKGFGKYLRVRYFLESLGESRSKLYIFFGWVPRNFICKQILKYAMPKLKEDFQKVFDSIQDEIKRKTKPHSVYSTKGFTPDAQWVQISKLDQTIPDLVSKGISKELVNQIFDWIKNADDNTLDRIRIKYLANKFDVQLEEVLLIFLYGCRLGIFTLSWDIVCPHCRGVRSSLAKLGDLLENDECEVCEIQFETTAINAIEVTFHIHPQVRIVQKQMYCAAEPNTKQHILLTKPIAGKKSFNTNLLLGKGLYRLRKKGEKKFQFVDIDPNHINKDILWLNETEGSEIKVAPKPNLVFENDSNDAVTIVLEERTEDKLSLRPTEIFNFQEFRDLFSEEAIATNLQLDIGIKTILFTDIVGSTRFYETEGDHGAFLQVREHFIKTNQIITNFQGVVVKTIGDAVMASFSSPLQALKASKEMLEWFHPENKHTPVRIRISIHTGNCLAVNLNSNIDYFGNTVNYTAKMQGMTDASEISISQTVFRDSEVRDYFRANEIKLRKVDFKLSWIDRTDPIYIWKV